MVELLVRKRGFTLIELLLVIVIVGVLAGISVPSFVRSMQGNRLRSAARTVAAAGRYARSMALLHQRPVAITFDVDGYEIVVDLASRRQPVDADAEDDEAVTDWDPHELEPLDTERATSVSGGDEPVIRIERHLDTVRIDRVHMTEGRHRTTVDDRDRVRIIYSSNGRCQPHEVVLEDAEGGQLVVVVDVLGGAEIRER